MFKMGNIVCKVLWNRILNVIYSPSNWQEKDICSKIHYICQINVSSILPEWVSGGWKSPLGENDPTVSSLGWLFCRDCATWGKVRILFNLKRTTFPLHQDTFDNVFEINSFQCPGYGLVLDVSALFFVVLIFC